MSCNTLLVNDHVVLLLSLIVVCHYIASKQAANQLSSYLVSFSKILDAFCNLLAPSQACIRP